jgi:hypothetical protein
MFVLHLIRFISTVVSVCWHFRTGSLYSIYAEQQNCPVILPSVCKAKTAISSVEKKESLIALDMPRIINIYVHF